MDESPITYSAVTYKMYPTRAQQEALVLHLRLTRELYNACIEERSVAYRKCGVSISVYDQKKHLPEIKVHRPEFKLIYNNVLQETVFKVDRAFKAFFNGIKKGQKVGYPRFQGRRGWDSFRYTAVQSGTDGMWRGPGKFVAGQRIRLPYIGDVKIRRHCDLPGRVATLSIVSRASGWYAIYTCEVPVPAPLPATGLMVGVDLGLKTFAATSDGAFFDAVRPFRDGQQKLARLQRAASRKKKGSRRWKEAQRQVARQHGRVADTRRFTQRQIINTLLSKYDMIALEKLNIRGLSRGMLAKSVLDAAWGQFNVMLDYKAERAGKTVVRVDPRHTTQLCSACGAMVPKTLRDRLHECPECGYEADRDTNAAQNILLRALGREPVYGGLAVES